MIETLKNCDDKVLLTDIFKQKLASLEALHDYEEKKSCWVFWDNKNYKFFEVDFYENGIY